MKNISSSGSGMKRTGLAMMITGIVISLVLRFVPGQDWDEALIIVSLLPVLLGIGGAFLFFRGRQHATKAVAESILSDDRPDVLYLRPFESDPSVAGQTFSALLTPVLISGMATEEEQLGEVLKPFGDLVAVGQPGESLPNPGAAKLYATDDEWQQVVAEQMKAARLVVIRAGNAPGVLWELKKIREILDPKKVLILVMAMSKRKYESFRVEAERMLGVSLPDRVSLKSVGGPAGFFRFMDDWTPEFLPLRAPRMRRSSYKPLRVAFKYALKPVFADYGLSWEEPPVSKLVVVAMSVLGLFGLLILAAIISTQ